MSSKRERADKRVVDAGLAESRTRAQALILAGQVVIGEHAVEKPGQLVDADAPVRLKGEALRYVSRGGLKLEKALDHFALDVRGLVEQHLDAKRLDQLAQYRGFGM